jgi:predicted O-methyltransferase YrrM
MTITVESALERYYTSGTVRDTDGRDRDLHSTIPSNFADSLTRTVADLRPKLAVEIGMAFGAASLAILRGLGPTGKLISIDPHQKSDWGAAGKSLVAQTDRAHQHELIEEFDYLALPQLLEGGTVVDFAYIDGMHTFDYVSLDAFYIDKMMPTGGVIAFNDCQFRAVHKYLRFFRSHRRYEEMDVGLPSNYFARNAMFSLIRRVERRSNQDRYFRKIESWEPQYDFYSSF